VAGYVPGQVLDEESVIMPSHWYCCW